MWTTPDCFVLPDLFAVCPLEASTNPHYASAARESSAWINSYSVFNDKKRAFFIQGSNELLVSYTYPYADHERFRTCCDFVNLLFVVDEVSDEQNGADARTTGNIFLNVMRDASWDDGSALARMTREFRARLLRYSGPGCFRRFLRHCEHYIEAVVKEAEYRELGQILDVVSFEPLRRENSAIRLCFGLFEFCFGVDLPDEIFDDPVFVTLYWAAADMVCWSNDVYSYNMEQARGIAGNNIVTVLMHEKGIDLQTSADLVGEHFTHLMDRFMAAKRQLPTWGSDVDRTVQNYVMAMEHWVVGNLEWSFQTQRYFGPLHAQIKQTRVVPIRDCKKDE